MKWWEEHYSKILKAWVGPGFLSICIGIGTQVFWFHTLYSFSYTIISFMFMLGSLYHLHIKPNRQLLSTVDVPRGGTRLAQRSGQFPETDGLGHIWKRYFLKQLYYWEKPSLASEKQGLLWGSLQEKRKKITLE